MAKSYKLKDGYMDSTGIVHNKNLLSDILNNQNVKVLYDSSSGSNGTITLNDSIANYSYIEIFYKDDNNIYNSSRFVGKTAKWCSLSVMQYDQNTQQVVNRGKNVYMSDKSITNGNYTALMHNSSGHWLYWNNNIYITHVVGYK